jgi:hypothetical protein
VDGGSRLWRDLSGSHLDPTSRIFAEFKTQYSLIQCFFFFLFWRNLAKFRPEKYDFDLCKGFSIAKMAQIRQISKQKGFNV